jgi:hypothetical protein
MKRLVRLSSIDHSLIQAKDGLLLLIDNKTEPKAGDTTFALGGTWNGTITQITGEPVTFGWKKIVASNDINSIELKNVHQLIIENVHEDKIYSEEDIRKAILHYEFNYSDSFRLGKEIFEDAVNNIILSLGKKECFIYIDQPNTSDDLNEEDWDKYYKMYERSDDHDEFESEFDWSLNSGKGQLALYNFSKIVTDNNRIKLIYK